MCISAFSIKALLLLFLLKSKISPNIFHQSLSNTSSEDEMFVMTIGYIKTHEVV